MKPISLTAAAALSAGASARSSGVRNGDAAQAPLVELPEASVANLGPLDPSPPGGGLTPETIIQRFAERESAFNQAREAYTFRQTVKVDTLSEDTNRPDGEYQQVTDITFDDAGRRTEHVVFAPQNTLERVMMSPADFKDIEQRLPFVLTTEELPWYNVTYLGRQHVDDLDTFVFEARPKVLEKNKRYFQGKVWVDQKDFQIVLVDGKNVPDDLRHGNEDLSPPFATYYEQIDGKYWFPTYTREEGNLHFKGGQGFLSQDVHMRTTVKYTDYKRFRSTSTIIYKGTVLKGPDSPAPGTPDASGTQTTTPSPGPPK